MLLVCLLRLGVSRAPLARLLLVLVWQYVMIVGLEPTHFLLPQCAIHALLVSFLAATNPQHA
jgi:hypothetical protein